MVIVPHQDDELLLTAGVLYSAAHAGLNPHVVMVTNGDYGCLPRPQRRICASA